MKPVSNAFSDAIVDARIASIRSLLLVKGAEYSPGDGDRLHNFNRAAAVVGTTPESALVGMWVKHLVSVLDLVDGIGRGELPTTARVDEKLGDTINYAILLEAMVKARLAEQAHSQTPLPF